MKEKLLDIILDRIRSADYGNDEYMSEMIDEISSMIYEFLDWIKNTCEMEFAVGDSETYVWYYPYAGIAFKTSEELFEYWYNNIRYVSKD